MLDLVEGGSTFEEVVTLAQALEARTRALEALKLVRLDGLQDRRPSQLSGGQQQRVAIARALAMDPIAMLFDEPTSALDVHHQFQLMALLSELNRTENVGIIVILHDLNLALRYATHIVALKKGQIAFEGNADMLLDEDRLSELYESPIKLIDHPTPANTLASQKVAVVCA